MVFTQSRFKEHIKTCLEQVEQHMHHPYASKYVTYPEVDIFQMHYCALFLNRHQCTAEQREIYCIALALIQLARDNHDQVGIDEIYNPYFLKVRQLTVLSGDYLNSYYYYYLVQKEQFEAIPIFAQAIKEMNELKVMLHDERGQLTLEENLQRCQHIKGKVMHAILELFGAPKLWGKVFDQLLHLMLHREMGIGDEEDTMLVESVRQEMAELEREDQQEISLWLDERGESATNGSVIERAIRSSSI